MDKLRRDVVERFDGLPVSPPDFGLIRHEANRRQRRRLGAAGLVGVLVITVPVTVVLRAGSSPGERDDVLSPAPAVASGPLGPVTTTANGLRLTLSLDQSLARVGSTVTARVEVENTTTRPVTYTKTGFCGATFAVTARPLSLPEELTPLTGESARLAERLIAKDPGDVPAHFGVPRDLPSRPPGIENVCSLPAREGVLAAGSNVAEVQTWVVRLPRGGRMHPQVPVVATLGGTSDVPALEAELVLTAEPGDQEGLTQSAAAVIALSDPDVVAWLRDHRDVEPRAQLRGGHWQIVLAPATAGSATVVVDAATGEILRRDLFS